MTTKRRRSSRGFTLVELLVAMLIIAILAAIAIWNYYLGIQKARQKRTMTDIRTLATAWEARAVDTRGYNAAAATAGIWPTVPLTNDQVRDMLEPTYIKVMPQRDGWDRYFDYAVENPIGGDLAVNYGVRSAGKDGVFDKDYPRSGPTTNFDCDIVYMNGTFVCYPEGTQQQ